MKNLFRGWHTPSRHVDVVYEGGVGVADGKRNWPSELGVCMTMSRFASLLSNIL